MLAFAWGLVLTRLAAAQDTTHADETFHAGRTLMDSGKLAEACPKFEESQRADPAAGTLLALAYCQELSGLLASAHGSYLAAADLGSEGRANRATKGRHTQGGRAGQTRLHPDHLRTYRAHAARRLEGQTRWYRGRAHRLQRSYAAQRRHSRD